MYSKESKVANINLSDQENEFSTGISNDHKDISNAEDQECKLGSSANHESNNKDTDDINKKLSKDLSLAELKVLREEHPFNPMIGYLNINFLQNKIIPLRDIVKKCPVDILCIDETKLDSSFPDHQFKIEGYQYPPFRRDREKLGGGKMVFIKDGLICKRLEKFETLISETICLELTINNKKWFLCFAYRPPIESNKSTFFDELTSTLNQGVNNYDNIILSGDLNIDLLNKQKDTNNYLSDFMDTFSLTNLVKSKTCFKSKEGSLIDLFLTNRPNCFQKTTTVVSGLSDVHNMIVTFLRAHFKKLPPKQITYRDYKKFNEHKFLHELDQEMIKGEFYKNETNIYEDFSSVFKRVADKHAPLKKKTVRGNNAPFMNKELSKAIMNRSRAKKKYVKYPSRENFLNMKKVKNKCNSISRKVKKKFFQESTKEGVNSNKKFWDLVKPFLTNKGNVSNDFISIKKGETFVENEKELVEMFNNHYINIVENISGKPPDDSFKNLNDAEAVKEIILKFENHPSILKIKENFTPSEKFEIPKAEVSDINSLLKKINTKKATGPDTLPPKLLRMSANVVDSHFCNVVNKDLSIFSYADDAKVASVNPQYKKKSRNEIENYRPVSILNAFSKIYERYIHNQLVPFVDKFLSKFISAYRAIYSTNHVLIKMIEDWKLALDNKKFVGAILMDLSKAFDCIPHDLLIAKMNAYGFSENSLIFFYSYLKRRKQSVKINNTHSIFQILLSGVPQGSILGPILFNIFINDFLMWIDTSNIYNFADDNTITYTSESLEDLVKTLEIESEKATEWFRINNMIVNPGKFQAIIIDRKGQKNNPTEFKIDNKIIKSEECVKLLGLEIDSKLSFDKHVSKLCNKSAGQLNALIRLKKYLRFEERKVLINSFIYSNFNYCPLVWHFCSKDSTKKVENIQKRALRFLLEDYESDYETLLKKSGKCTMKIKRIRTLALEIFKTLNDLNPAFMKSLIENRLNSKRRNNDLIVPFRKTVKFGDKSIRCLGPHIWNALPNEIKSESSYEKFKSFINSWFGPKCHCNFCIS